MVITIFKKLYFYITSSIIAFLRNRYILYTTRSHSQNMVDISDVRLRNRIRELAKDSSKVMFSKHARERSLEREITVRDTVRILRTGDFSEPVKKNMRTKEYRFKFEGRAKGRLIAVVGVMHFSEKGNIYVITVEYVIREGAMK